MIKPWNKMKIFPQHEKKAKRKIATSEKKNEWIT